MENEIKVNEYVRSNQGIFIISHINIKFDDNDYRKVCLCQNEKVAFTSIDNIKKLKHSPNLKDLIEIGDLVKIEDDCGAIHWFEVYENSGIYQYEILEIATKEMMESISYKVTKM